MFQGQQQLPDAHKTGMISRLGGGPGLAVCCPLIVLDTPLTYEP